jgi:hypothetical protein
MPQTRYEDTRTPARSLNIMRHLLLAYALLNAVLYSTLVPLWEGFDEPFHFGYVQQIANGDGLPDARNATLSREIAASLVLVPGSHVVKQNIPQVITYRDYFALAPAQKSELKEKLSRMPRALREQPSDFPNYEAHHAPLAYILMALPERLFAGQVISRRVLAVRLFIAIAGSMLLYAGISSLCSRLSIPAPYSSIGLFCVLSSQMTWATIAHVANDWLALPIAIWVLVSLLRYVAEPDDRNAAALAILMAAGLLTKAYFLALVPLVPVVTFARRGVRHLLLSTALMAMIAGPWYARNIARYGVITGMQESRAGIGPPQVLQAASAVNWVKAIPSAAREALWTGNNTFSSFSAVTLNTMLVVCTLGLVLWLGTRHASAEWLTTSYCSLFLLALVYSTVMTYLFTHQNGAGPSPWYTQILVAPLFLLVVLGLSRWGRIGKSIGIVLIILSGYLLTATYVLKLIPLYAGYEGRSTVQAILKLYTSGLPDLLRNLNDVALAPAIFILCMTALIVVLTLTLQIALLRSLFAKPQAC